jgi:hypothetical protein
LGGGKGKKKGVHFSSQFKQSPTLHKKYRLKKQRTLKMKESKKKNKNMVFNSQVCKPKLRNSRVLKMNQSSKQSGKNVNKNYINKFSENFMLSRKKNKVVFKTANELDLLKKNKSKKVLI